MQDDDSGLVAEVFEVKVNHQYLVGSNGAGARHDCLAIGWWCWQNARQHPFDVVRYLRKKSRLR